MQMYLQTRDNNCFTDVIMTSSSISFFGSFPDGDGDRSGRDHSDSSDPSGMGAGGGDGVQRETDRLTRIRNLRLLMSL